MKKEYLDNAIVKSLLAADFSEEYIEKAIANGDIKIEKAEDKAARGDHESETKQEEDIDELEKEAVKKEEKVKEDEKNTAEDKDAEGVEKSKEDMMKSMESTILKSVGSVFAPIIERMAESMENISSKLDKIGEVTPSFRSQGLDNMSALQKSMNIDKDEAGKYEINIINQRPIASKMIEKALENETDDSIVKSLQRDALNFMTNPYADTVGEELARYMYNKTGVKFVK